MQKKNKKPTLISDQLINKLEHLSSTKIYPCSHMISATKTLIVRDHETALIDITNKLSSISVENTLDLNAIITHLCKQKIILQEINRKTKDQTVGTLSDIYQSLKNSNEKTVQEIINFSLMLTNQSKTLNNTHKRNNITHIVLSALQDFVSKLRLMNLALHFFDTLTKNSIEYFYYSIFIDFRGRVYYKSPCSPQAY